MQAVVINEGNSACCCSCQPPDGFPVLEETFHALDLLDQLARSASGGATEQEEVFCSTPCLPLLPELNTGEWGGMMMIQQTCKAIADLVHSSRWQTGQA